MWSSLTISNSNGMENIVTTESHGLTRKKDRRSRLLKCKNYPVDGKKRNVLKVNAATKAQTREVKIQKPFSLGALAPWWQ